MKKPGIAVYVLFTVMALLLSGCGNDKADPPSGADMSHEEQSYEKQQTEPEGKEDSDTGERISGEEPRKMLQLKIADTAVEVAWEDNESVEALEKLCEEEPLTIQMSMYGGFEQVGPIGTGLPSNDVQTTTRSGDIVLYSGDQIVAFYGSNSWDYTMLGHITDQDTEGMTKLLGNGDVTITISMDKEKEKTFEKGDRYYDEDRRIENGDRMG